MTFSYARPAPEPRLINHSRTLRLLPAPALDGQTLAMAATRSGAPLFTGNGFVDYTCASCGAVLCQRMRTGQLAGLVFRCACGELNRVPGA
jgi:predicted RNA-binding Zn-ribbon protein involved in translation (DUF1610 family)